MQHWVTHWGKGVLGGLERVLSGARAGLYLIKADVTVYSGRD